MLPPLVALAALALQPPIARIAPSVPAPIIMVSDRVLGPTQDGTALPFEDISIRATSPQGLLWQGTLRIGPSQGASCQHYYTQAPADRCAPGSPFDRSERSSLLLSVQAQNNRQWGQGFRLDATWTRPVRGEACGEGGSRTVQINQAFPIAPGETTILEGDAGLRVQLSRPR